MTTVTKQRKSRVCEECGAEAKYTCPGCHKRTCSSQCIKRHKEATDCTGTRNKTKLVYKEDMDNLTLLSDYRFLEEVDNRLEDNVRSRLLRSAKRPQDERLSLPPHLQQLKNQAAQRGTTLRFMPSFFSSHRENTTRYHFKDGIIRWHIKWIFHQADVTFTDHSIDENTTLTKLLAKYMNPSDDKLSVENKEKLAYYHSASYGKICVLIKTEIPEFGHAFRELETRRSLRVNFANKVIVEYPVLYVVLKHHVDSYLNYHCENESDDDLFSAPEGKEEQVKEGLKYFEAGSDMEQE